MIAPARALRYSDDGRGLVLEDGRSIEAGMVVLATGYKSSWDKLFDGAHR